MNVTDVCGKENRRLFLGEILVLRGWAEKYVFREKESAVNDPDSFLSAT